MCQLDLFGSGTIVGIVYLARRFEGAFWARIVRLFDFHPGRVDVKMSVPVEVLTSNHSREH